MAAKKPISAAGAPRWTYIVGTLVAVAGLVWGIVSFVLAARAQNRPTATTAAPVSVSGTGNVAVGTMSGGSITVGAPQKADGSEASRVSK